MGWGPVDWVGRVLPEAKFENKWTLFFEFFDLSDCHLLRLLRAVFSLKQANEIEIKNWQLSIKGLLPFSLLDAI